MAVDKPKIPLFYPVNLLTKEDFERALKKILEFVAKIDMRNEKMAKEFRDIMTDIRKQLEKDYDKNIGMIERNVNTKFVELFNQLSKKVQDMLDEQQNGMNYIYDKVDRLEHGRDGKDADETKMIESIKEFFQTFFNSTFEEFNEIIKKLKEEIEELRNRPVGRIGGGFSKIAMDSHILNWTTLGVGDGTTTNFTLVHTPNPTASLEIMVGNSPLFLTDDYTYNVSTKVVSFLIAPPDGQRIRYKCLL